MDHDGRSSWPFIDHAVFGRGSELASRRILLDDLGKVKRGEDCYAIRVPRPILVLDLNLIFADVGEHQSSKRVALTTPRILGPFDHPRLKLSEPVPAFGTDDADECFMAARLSLGGGIWILPRGLRLSSSCLLLADAANCPRELWHGRLQTSAGDGCRLSNNPFFPSASR
jgi:hypothetical protein